MSLSYCTATSESDLHQILSLQRINHASAITPEKASQDGFVTVVHSFELLRKMNDTAPQVIAKDEERVAGYALVMLRSFEDMIPVLKPMFERLSTICYKNRSVVNYSFYVMGQICVAEPYRGKGVFDSLYHKHRELYRSDFELCVTSVATRNQRSMRAHKRVGFKIVNTFRDATDEWSILVWDWK